MLARLARFSFRRRAIMVFAIWLPVLVALNALSSAVGTDYRTEFNMPNSESKLVQDAFNDIGNEEDAGFPAQIVFSAAQGNTDPAVQTAMTTLFEQIDALDGVKVVSPYAPDGAQQNSPADAPTNSFGYDVSFAQLTISERDQAGFMSLADDIQELGAEVNVPGLSID